MKLDVNWSDEIPWIGLSQNVLLVDCWHRDHASYRTQVPRKPHVYSELRDGGACDDAGYVRMDMEKSSKTHGLNLDEFAT